MARLFFLLSGEHLSLPFSELESILTAEGYEYHVLGRLPQVFRIETDSSSIKVVESRSAMTRICGLEFFNCDAVFEEILEKTRGVSLESFLRPDENFAVRIVRVRGASSHLVRVGLEKKLGAMIVDEIRGVRVNLRSPQKTFFGILTENRFIFGLKMAEVATKPFFARRPQKRPFFHPTAMPPKLARCMVNLAQPRRSELLLDPFCGTASMLIEAGLIGCRVLGFDVQNAMVKGSLQNLFYFGVQPDGMAVADAKHPPVREVDCVVTDPPYGRSATTLGWSTREIIDSFLSTIGEVLLPGRRVCMAAPRSVKIGQMGKALGFKHVESHLVYVHRSLTREIAVFERT